MSIKTKIIDNLKNINGWKTNRKLIVLSIDDYGNLRIGSKEIINQIEKLGIGINSRFDMYDSLETTEDLSMLYEALTSVKDKFGNYPIFTCYALPCNLNYEAILKSNFEEYSYEQLPVTFEKLAQLYPNYYQNTWNLWQEGIKMKLLSPEFHGREHVNIEEFKYQRNNNFKLLKLLFENRTYSFLPELNGNRIYTAAFSFNDFIETSEFDSVISTGLEEFEKVFHKKAFVFTPPSQQFPPFLEANLFKYGLKAIDKPFYAKVHLGNGKFEKSFTTTKFNKRNNIFNIVRNVVFEPSEKTSYDPVNLAMNQIEIAFNLNRVANISSHRINFSGFISEENRKIGLSNLKILLTKIVMKWPEVEFISASDLIDIISKEK